jgi:stearoyl-CoA desaturase (Delta-9 desaturase)
MQVVSPSSDSRDVAENRTILVNDKLRWSENAPFWIVHAVALAGAIWVGWSWQAAVWLASSYVLRMFTVTGVYHRYFSHRTYKTSRVAQFIFALIGVTSVQKGPLWWASHHRRHHKHSDTPEDIHSPRQRGFWWSHMFWILAERYQTADLSNLKDFTKYPELRFLDRFEQAIVVVAAAILFAVGGATALFWGFFVPTVLVWHATFAINSLAHVWGGRRYQTTDDSRNNALLALVTLGEGWHNNHHHYQRSARQGFYWWEIDISFYILKVLSWFRIVWDVEGVPAHVRDVTTAPQRKRVQSEQSSSVKPANAQDALVADAVVAAAAVSAAPASAAN